MSSRVSLHRVFVALAFTVVAGYAVDVSSVQGRALTADQLVANVLAARATSGFRIRAKITRVAIGPDGKEGQKQDLQLLIKSRREGKATDLLYQLLFPAALAGHAVVLEDRGDHHLAGFAFAKGVVATFPPTNPSESLFDTDLTIEDIAELYWYWPTRAIAGNDVIDKRPCVVVEMRPAPDSETAYALVKACIAPDVSLPLRIQLIGRDGKLRRTIVSERIVKQSNQWVAGRLIITPADGRTRTVIEGSRYERDLTFPTADFSVAAVKNFGKS